MLLRATFSDLKPPTNSPGFINQHPQQISLLPPKKPDAIPLASHQVNSREGLEELVVCGTLCLVEREAQGLANADGGLARGAGMTWDDIDNISREDQEQSLRELAPIILTLLSTIVLVRSTSTVGDSIDQSRTVSGEDPEIPTAGSSNTGSNVRDPSLVSICNLNLFFDTNSENDNINYHRE